MNLRILTLHNQSEAELLMKEIGVDTAGIGIMAPKTIINLVRIPRLAIFAAHILKQEALSLGADTAVSRDALSGKTKYTDCIIMGNLLHFKRLCEKLKMQPYGLSKVASELQCALANYHRSNFVLNLGRYKLNLNSHTHIMGIINMTPDSFSGDGFYQGTGDRGQGTDVGEYAQKLADEGADIVDVGGESSRPGSKPVSLSEELKRVIPAIKKISKKIKVPISVDTYKSEVAKQALDNGARIVNDITALGGDPKMAKVVSKYKAAVVLMHMKGRPYNMQKNPEYGNIMDEIAGCLNRRVAIALNAGIDFEKIIVDPGIGFGKTLEHNLKIIKSLQQLKVLGRPILAGVSRKSFIGKIIQQPVESRLCATLSVNCLSVIHGASILRVHEVKETKQALMALDSVLRCQ